MATENVENMFKLTLKFKVNEKLKLLFKALSITFFSSCVPNKLRLLGKYTHFSIQR